MTTTNTGTGEVATGHKIRVRIYEAHDLPATNYLSSTKSDTYAVLTLLGTGASTSGVQNRTEIIKGTRSPRYETTFELNLSENPARNVINVSVYASHVITSDSFVGRIEFPIALLLGGRSGGAIESCWFPLLPLDPLFSTPFHAGFVRLGLQYIFDPSLASIHHDLSLSCSESSRSSDSSESSHRAAVSNLESCQISLYRSSSPTTFSPSPPPLSSPPSPPSSSSSSNSFSKSSPPSSSSNSPSSSQTLLYRPSSPISSQLPSQPNSSSVLAHPPPTQSSSSKEFESLLICKANISAHLIARRYDLHFSHVRDPEQPTQSNSTLQQNLQPSSTPTPQQNIQSLSTCNNNTAPLYAQPPATTHFQPPTPAESLFYPPIYQFTPSALPSAHPSSTFYSAR